MNRPTSRSISRKEALSGLIVLPALAAAFVAGATAPAEAKASRASAHYQNHPNGKQQCSGCTLFIPGKTPTASGQCKVVEGFVSPKGWCTFYAPKG